MDIEAARCIREGRRVLSTECVFYPACVNVCPEGVLTDSFGLDLGGAEYLRRRS
jgi:ferredoxin